MNLIRNRQVKINFLLVRILIIFFIGFFSTYTYYYQKEYSVKKQEEGTALIPLNIITLSGWEKDSNGVLQLTDVASFCLIFTQSTAYKLKIGINSKVNTRNTNLNIEILLNDQSIGTFKNTPEISVKFPSRLIKKGYNKIKVINSSKGGLPISFKYLSVIEVKDMLNFIRGILSGLILLAAWCLYLFLSGPLRHKVSLSYVRKMMLRRFFNDGSIFFAITGMFLFVAVILFLINPYAKSYLSVSNCAFFLFAVSILIRIIYMIRNE
ncbi:MAG: hypothetical protein WC723_03415 [Candidatus Omnitrophota bacterium]